MNSTDIHHRCDTIGAVNFLTQPHILEQKPPISLPAPPPSANPDYFIQILSSCGIDLELISTLECLSTFSQIIDHAVTQNLATFDPLEFVQKSCLIQQNLLLFLPPDFLSAEQKALHSACKMGALIYIRTVLQEFPLSQIGSKNLASQLRNSLHHIQGYAIPTPLHLWLCFVGGTGLQSSADRSWFIASIVQVLRNLFPLDFRIGTWEQMRNILRKLPWIEKFHDRDYRIVWEEVEATKSVLYPDLS